jgi:hypothetical protein
MWHLGAKDSAQFATAWIATPHAFDEHLRSNHRPHHKTVHFFAICEVNTRNGSKGTSESRIGLRL